MSWRQWQPVPIVSRLAIGRETQSVPSRNVVLTKLLETMAVKRSGMAKMKNISGMTPTGRSSTTDKHAPPIRHTALHRLRPLQRLLYRPRPLHAARQHHHCRALRHGRVLRLWRDLFQPFPQSLRRRPSRSHATSTPWSGSQQERRRGPCSTTRCGRRWRRSWSRMTSWQACTTSSRSSRRRPRTWSPIAVLRRRCVKPSGITRPSPSVSPVQPSPCWRTSPKALTSRVCALPGGLSWHGGSTGRTTSRTRRFGDDPGCSDGSTGPFLDEEDSNGAGWKELSDHRHGLREHCVRHERRQGHHPAVLCGVWCRAEVGGREWGVLFWTWGSYPFDPAAEFADRDHGTPYDHQDLCHRVGARTTRCPISRRPRLAVVRTGHHWRWQWNSPDAPNWHRGPAADWPNWSFGGSHWWVSQRWMALRFGVDLCHLRGRTFQAVRRDLSAEPSGNLFVIALWCGETTSEESPQLPLWAQSRWIQPGLA